MIRKRKWMWIVASLLILGFFYLRQRPSFPVPRLHQESQQEETFRKIKEKLQNVYGVRDAYIGYGRDEESGKVSQDLTVVLYLKCSPLSTNAFYRAIGRAVQEVDANLAESSSFAMHVVGSEGVREERGTDRPVIFSSAEMKKLLSEKETQPLKQWCPT